jgi:hypothetical protein
MAAEPKEYWAGFKPGDKLPFRPKPKENRKYENLQSDTSDETRQTGSC